MVILDPYGIIFDAVGVFGLAFQLLFKSGSSYCVLLKLDLDINSTKNRQKLNRHNSNLFCLLTFNVVVTIMLNSL